VARDESLTGAHILVRALERRGVTLIWGFPGDLPDFIEALRGSSVDYLPTRHGQTVAFVAEAVGRFADRPTVCLAALEYDTVHLMTVVANAYLNGAPVLILLDDAVSPSGRAVLQSCTNLIQQARPMLKLAVTVNSASEIPAGIDRAYDATLRGRPGPVIVTLGQGVLAGPGGPDVGVRAPRRVVLESVPAIDNVQLDAVYRALRGSRVPVVLAGDEIVRERSDDAFLAFTERFDLPVFTTLDAKGVIPENHPLSLGVLAGDLEGAWELLVKTADLIVFVGCRDVAALPWALRNRTGKAQVVSISNCPSPAEAIGADMQVVTNLRNVLERLTALDPAERPPWRPGLADLRKRVGAIATARSRESVSLCELLDVIRKHLRPDDVVVCGVELNATVGAHFKALRPRTVVFSGPSGFGFAVPGAIGIKSTDPARRVVALCGDASLMMSVQELETSIRSDIPIIVVLVEPRESPRRSVRGLRHRGDRVPFVNDVLALVNSFGGVAVRTRNSADFERAFRQACQSPLTTLVVAPTVQVAESQTPHPARSAPG
jgi:acetolactate synthase-1/2/3 large subunit